MQQLQTGHIFQVQIDQGHVNISGLRQRRPGGSDRKWLKAFGLEDIPHGSQQVGVIIY
jgi:hypothetical protein